ncbi:MAG: enoyl-CoA hydratase/isomerase family protein [Kineosporiaceae bacterium]|nr:enoyl-CoA hydratase/isomerase family protein [Kineosporiaceae bacterium]
MNLTGQIGAVRYERDDDGIVTLTLDDPAASANTMNQAYEAGMAAALDRLTADIAAGEVAGVIVTSAKKTFFAGGDIPAMMAAGPEHAVQLTAQLGRLKSQLRRLETCGRPVVAAINGTALGGGFEIALACHHRIVLEHPATRIGLPEVTLGLLPGAGGVTRTVRMLGITDALMTVLLEGRRFPVRRAAELGLVDDVVTTPEAMMAAARAWIAANPNAAQPWDSKGYRIPGGTPSTPALAANLPAYPANLRKRLAGAPLPAPKAIMAAAVEGAQVDVDTALAIETRYFVSLAIGQTSTNMMKAFFVDLQTITKGAARPAGFERWRPQRVAVLGAGMMGAGIAYAFAAVGVDVVLKDVTGESAARGKGYSEKLVAKAVDRGRMDAAAAQALLARITPTAEVADLAGCDLVVEAVFEDPGLKRQVFGEVVGLLAPDALLASNTSTLPITDLAHGVDRPEDFIGLHFFSPVDKMPLVEIVVGERTGDAALARAFDVVQLIRKTPIVVNDSRGFFTSRVIGAFLDEAVGMLAEGVHPQTIEQAALQAGYPTGPLALTDEVSLTLTRHIRAAFAAAAAAEGTSFPARASHAVIDRLVEEFARPGRAGRAGFYDYGEDGARRGLWPGLVEHFPPRPAVLAGREGADDIPFVDLQERMLFAEAIDSVNCLDEGVLRSVAEGNIGSLLGIGFPSWTGGVLQYIEGYPGGVAGFVARAHALAARYGERFVPPASLVARVAPSASAG